MAAVKNNPPQVIVRKKPQLPKPTATAAVCARIGCSQPARPIPPTIPNGRSYCSDTCVKAAYRARRAARRAAQ
jgi:hypothetical protein